MSAHTVVLRVDHPCYVGGAPRSVGEKVTVPALAAADLVACKRCSLVDPAELAVVNDAAVAELQRQNRAGGISQARCHDGWMRIT